MDKLSELKASATEAATKVSTAATTVLTDEAAREDLLKKLTLNTDELKAERAQMDAEENRKANVKDQLARLLPWETTDEEREILCEECKDKILSMSQEKATFTGPFALVGQSNTEVAAKDNNYHNDGDKDDSSSAEPDAAGEKEGGDNKEEASSGPNDSGGESSTKPDLSDAAVEAARMEAKKAKLAQSSAAAVEVDEQRCMGELRGMLRTAQKQQPVVHSDSAFKGTAADKKEIKREAYKKAVRLFSTQRKKPNNDPSKLSLREVEDFIKAEHKGIGPGKDSIHRGAERFETTGTAEIKCYVLIHGGLCATTSLMHQSTCQQHPPGPETTAATCRARDHCDCYALLSLVSLLVRTPCWHAVLVDHKRRETALPHGNWPPPS